MPKIKCLPDRVNINAKESDTILQSLLDNGITHTHVCGGNAYCSTCRVMILEGIDNCSQPTVAEKALARRLEFPFHVRLACQTRVSGNVSIRRLVLDEEDIDFVEGQLSAESLGGKKSVAVLFATVRGAHNFDEVNFYYDLIYIMSRYFQRMNKTINSYGGFINNYMNYWLMGVFGLNNGQDAAERAVWAALEMFKVVEELNIYLERLSYPPVYLSIGIHYGPVVLVPIETHKESGKYTLVGDTVNLVSRIEGINRELGSELLISGDVYNQVSQKVTINRTYTLKSVSKNKEYPIFEVTSITGDAPTIIETVEVMRVKGSLGKRIKSFMQKFSSSWSKPK